MRWLSLEWWAEMSNEFDFGACSSPEPHPYFRVSRMSTHLSEDQDLLKSKTEKARIPFDWGTLLGYLLIWGYCAVCVLINAKALGGY